jgi:hypothetical protein
VRLLNSVLIYFQSAAVMAQQQFGPCPPRFVDIKREIAASYPDFEDRVTRAWNDVLGELERATSEIAAQSSEVRFIRVVILHCHE